MCEVSRPTLKHPAWWLLAVPMAVPALLVVAALAVMLFYSFTDFDVLTPAVFVGLQNYARLFSEPLYWRAVGNTLLYLLVAGGVSVALGWLCGTGAARLPLPLRLILLVLFGVGTMLSFCQYGWFNLIFSGDAYGLLNALLLQPSTSVGDVSAAGGLITAPVQWAAMYPTVIRLLQLILIGVGPSFFIFYVGGRTGRSRAAWHVAVAALPVWFILYWVITITATGTPTMGYAGLWLPEYLYDYFYTRFDIGYSAVILMNLILLVAVLVGVAQTIVWLCTRHGRPAALLSRPGARHWCGGAVGMFIGVLVLLLVVLLFSCALKPPDEMFLFPPKFFVQSPTWNNFRLLESFPGGFLHLLPMYVIVSVVYFLTAILPPAVFFAFSSARLRRPLLIVWMSIFALTPFAFTSVLWWRISIVDALGPVLRLCCHFSPLYPTCLLLTALLLRRTAAGCHRFLDFFCSARRVLCMVAGVVGCGLLFPLSLLFTLNGTHLVYSSNYYFPLQQVGLRSGITSFGVGSAGTMVLLFVGLVLLLVGLIGMTVAAHVAVKCQRVG